MAKKFYKNLTGRVISTSLYGVGDVKIPADAACVELDENVADAINGMTYIKILEETEPQLKESPIAVVEDLGTLEEDEKPAPKKRPSRAKKK